MANSCLYLEASDKIVPFSKAMIDGKEYIYLPSNFEDLMADKTMSVILILITSLGCRFSSTTEKLSFIPSTEEARLFWAGYYNRLKRKVSENQSIKFSGTKAHERGRACADAEILLHNCGVISMTDYLPESVFSGGKKLINTRIANLGGATGLRSLGQLPLRIMEASKNLIKQQDADFKRLVSEVKVPYSNVIKNIARTKKVESRENGKLISRLATIHIVKPSTCIEAVLPSENNLLQHIDKPWQEMKNLYEAYKGGVSIDKIVEVREQYRRFYNSQLEANSTIASWKAQRRAAIDQLMSLIHVKKGVKYQEKHKNIICDKIADIFLDSEELDTKEKSILSSFNAEGLYNALRITVPSWAMYSRAESVRSESPKFAKNFKALHHEEQTNFHNYMGQISMRLTTYYDIDEKTGYMPVDSSSGLKKTERKASASKA